MATAVCRQCGAQWTWRASKGSSLRDLKCSDCGGPLGQRRTLAYATRASSFNRWHDQTNIAWPLGTTPEERIRQMTLTRDQSANEEFRARCDLEIFFAQNAIARRNASK